MIPLFPLSVMAGLDPATQGHALLQRHWVAGSAAGHDEALFVVTG
jgi:hypothetical protein